MRTFVNPPADLTERFEVIMGITYDESAVITEIIFWISDRSKDYIANKPLHGSQKIIRGDELKKLKERYSYLKNGSFFKILCKENYELIRELTSFGADLIVVEPKEIISRLEDRLITTLEYYSSSKYI